MNTSTFMDYDYSDANEENALNKFKKRLIDNPTNLFYWTPLDNDDNNHLSGSFYTKKDDDKDKLFSDYLDIDRLADIERKLIDYENKFNMKSEEFYKKWKENQDLDSCEFNKWAELCSFLNYDKN